MPTCPAGHQVESKDLIYCPVCGQKMPTRDEVVCPNGHTVAGHHRFCPECGAQLVSSRWLWLGGAALVVLLGLLLFTVLPPSTVADKSISALQEGLDWISSQLSRASLPGV